MIHAFFDTMMVELTTIIYEQLCQFWDWKGILILDCSYTTECRYIRADFMITGLLFVVFFAKESVL